MRETVTVEVKDGIVTISTAGFRGGACEQATRELERALGKRISNTRTPEFQHQERQVNRGGAA